jgi:hypothetical protein
MTTEKNFTLTVLGSFRVFNLFIGKSNLCKGKKVKLSPVTDREGA